MYLSFRDDFRIGLVISPRVAVLAWGVWAFMVNWLDNILLYPVIDRNIAL